MQVKVNLSPSDCQAIRAMAQGDQHYWECLAATLQHAEPDERAPSWLIKLAQAIEQPAKPAKRTKAPFGRADLKGQVEQFRDHWRFVEGAKGADESCIHCAKPLRQARLTRLGNGAVEGIGHLACAIPWMQRGAPVIEHASVGNFNLNTYTEQDTADTAAIARTLAKAA